MSKKKEKTPIIVKEGPEPCGCYHTEFSDGTVKVRPCVPCGIMEAAQALSGAAAALAAVSASMRSSIQQALIRRSVDDVAKGPKGLIT